MDTDALGARERAFVESSAHADFLIFRRIDGKVVFEVEVNGAQHADPRQVGRDKLKRAILDRYSIPHDVVRANEAQHELERHVQRILDVVCAADGAHRSPANVAAAIDAE